MKKEIGTKVFSMQARDVQYRVNGHIQDSALIEWEKHTEGWYSEGEHHEKHTYTVTTWYDVNAPWAFRSKETRHWHRSPSTGCNSNPL